MAGFRLIVQLKGLSHEILNFFALQTKLVFFVWMLMPKLYIYIYIFICMYIYMYVYIAKFILYLTNKFYIYYILQNYFFFRIVIDFPNPILL